MNDLSLARRITMHPHLTALSLYAAIWLGLFGLTGNLTSCYDSIDDHEILIMNSEIHSVSGGWAKTSARWIKEDLLETHRFRPGYYLYRVTESLIMGDRLQLWSYWGAILLVLTSFLLFLFCINCGFGWTLAFVFPFLCFLGIPIETWFRRAPAEAPACFFMGLCLFSMSVGIITKKRAWIWDIFCIFSAIGLCLCKETFIVTIPAMLFLKVWQRHDVRRDSWVCAIRNELFILVSMTLVMIVSLLLLRQMGITGTSYAGFDSRQSLNVNKIIKTIIAFNSGKYLIYSLLILGIFVAWWIAWKRNPSSISNPQIFAFAPVIVFCAMLISLQAIIYAKSGLIADRYFLPSTIGFGFFFVWACRHASQRLPFAAWIIGLYLLFLGVINGSIAVNHLSWHAQEIKSLDMCLSAIHTDATTSNRVLIVADPIKNYEWSFSMLIYMTHKLKFPEDSIAIYAKRSSNSTKDGQPDASGDVEKISKWYKGRMVTPASAAWDFQYILIPCPIENDFWSEVGKKLAASSYTRVSTGNYSIYSKTPSSKSQ